MGEVSLGSSPSIGPGMSSSPGMAGLGSTTSMGSAPAPRNLMAANAFASAQGLHNRNLSDLGSYLELLSLSRGQEQVLIIPPFQSLCQDMQTPKVAAAASVLIATFQLTSYCMWCAVGTDMTTTSAQGCTLHMPNFGRILSREA